MKNQTTKTRQRALAILAASFMTAANGTTAAQAQTFKVLHTFGGPDGATPMGGLVRDSAGNLYGTTSAGALGAAICQYGCGVVFKVDKTGVETVLHSFTGGADGGNPVAGLLRDSAGNLYGTTQLGGGGYGVVFKLDTANNETVLHTFLGTGPDGVGDGAAPMGVLIEDSKGNLYGTTQSGGYLNQGTIFKLSPTGQETVFTFNTQLPGFNLGGFPYAGVIRDSQGNLYGTSGGGTNSSTLPEGQGVVYKLTESELVKNTEGTILHTFTGFDAGIAPDGARPYYGSLLRDSAGNLYGTTYTGGILGNCPVNAGCGTIFKVDAAGAETILYNFTGGADGGYPAEGLIRDSAGNLYGTGLLGGTSGGGVVFKLDTTGTLTVLHSFTGGADGCLPISTLVRDAAGNLYGTASGGGGGFGVVFKIKP